MHCTPLSTIHIPKINTNKRQPLPHGKPHIPRPNRERQLEQPQQHLRATTFSTPPSLRCGARERDPRLARPQQAQRSSLRVKGRINARLVLEPAS